MSDLALAHSDCASEGVAATVLRTRCSQGSEETHVPAVTRVEKSSGTIARAVRNAALAKAYFGGSTAGKLTTAKATGAAPATKGEPMSGVSAPVIGFAEKT
jgi:hypothetical protein